MRAPCDGQGARARRRGGRAARRRPSAARWRPCAGAHRAVTARGAAQARALARQAEARAAGRGAPGRPRPEQRHLLARLALDAERSALAAERAGEAREAAAGRAAAAAVQRCGALRASARPRARTCTAGDLSFQAARRLVREGRSASCAPQRVHGRGGGGVERGGPALCPGNGPFRPHWHPQLAARQLCVSPLQSTLPVMLGEPSDAQPPPHSLCSRLIARDPIARDPIARDPAAGRGRTRPPARHAWTRAPPPQPPPPPPPPHAACRRPPPLRWRRPCPRPRPRHPPLPASRQVRAGAVCLDALPRSAVAASIPCAAEGAPGVCIVVAAV